MPTSEARAGLIRILGIDPGSQRTGIGVIDLDRSGQTHYIHCEMLNLLQADSFPARLGQLCDELDKIIARFQPQQAAVESVFMDKNAMSALKLGQARGAAIATVVRAGLPVHEYAPRLIKQSLVGRGAAVKGQVQHMVSVLLNLSQKPQADAADALAVALTHAHMSATAARGNRAAGLMWRRR